MIQRSPSPTPLRSAKNTPNPPPQNNLGNQSFAQSFLNRFNHFRISGRVSPVLACYTRIRRRQCTIPSLPSSPSPGGAFPSPPLTVPSRAFHAIPNRSEAEALTQRHPNHCPPYPRCDASYKKSPQDASQNLRPHPQPIEKIGACNVMNDNSTYRRRCVTRVGCSAGLAKPAPGPRPPGPPPLSAHHLPVPCG